jgi:hypothetical protein
LRASYLLKKTLDECYGYHASLTEDRRAPTRSDTNFGPHYSGKDSTIMSRVFSAIADSEDSAIEPSTAPTTPDGSLTFSPVLQATQLLDAFDGITGVQSHSARGSSATLDLDGKAPMVVKNICCVGAGYVGESRLILFYLWSAPPKIRAPGLEPQPRPCQR